MFRFTIRDVLWLTVVVAVLAAWNFDRAQFDRELNKHATLTLDLGRKVQTLEPGHKLEVTYTEGRRWTVRVIPIPKPATK